MIIGSKLNRVNRPLILIFVYYNTLAEGLHQVTQPEMGVISRVTDG